MLRCSGGSVRACEETMRSPTWISPTVGSRNPAISRNVVVLPQPEGPSRQISCPWSILSETLSTTASDPNRLVSLRNSTDANQITPSSLCQRAFPSDQAHTPCENLIATKNRVPIVGNALSSVMAGLDPAIHVFDSRK